MILSIGFENKIFDYKFSFCLVNSNKIQKMEKKSQISFILLSIAFAASLISSATPLTSHTNESPRIRLRTGAISKMLSDLAKNYEQQRKLQEEIEIRKMKKGKNEQFAKEEIERQKIFQHFLGSRHPSSSFFSDFHADRYF